MVRLRARSALRRLATVLLSGMLAAACGIGTTGTASGPARDAAAGGSPGSDGAAYEDAAATGNAPSPGDDASGGSPLVPDVVTASDPGDVAVDSATGASSDAEDDVPADAAGDASFEGAVDAVADVLADTSADVGSGVGPTCASAQGGPITCNAGEHCCLDSSSFAESCSATCTGTTYPFDCPGSTGPGGCGAGTVCCGTLVLDGGLVGSCSVASFTSSCQATCAENLPGASCGSTRSPLTFTVRMCTAASDCAGDSNRTHCCAYNGGSNYWCVASTTLTSSCK